MRGKLKHWRAFWHENARRGAPVLEFAKKKRPCGRFFDWLRLPDQSLLVMPSRASRLVKML